MQDMDFFFFFISRILKQMLELSFFLTKQPFKSVFYELA